MRKILLENPISVSDYINILNEILSGVDVRVCGEVSGLKKAASGHLYFMLKDESGEGVINCAIWNSVYRMCGLDIEEGMKIIISGSADVYPVRGTLTFKVRTLQLAGEGALKKAYEERKKKLYSEGVFDNERDLPEYPQKVGLITSMRGAAIHDFTGNLGKFGFKVITCDSRVEGQEAVPELLRAVKRMKKENIDVLVIIRGGGSIESLAAFDNEMLVREVASFPVPVIAGVGHHEDVTLVALASDRSESTPTAAANLLGRGFEKAKEKVSKMEVNIMISFKNELERAKKRFERHLKKISFFFSAILEEYKNKERLVIHNILLLDVSIQSLNKEMNRNWKMINELFLSITKRLRNNIQNEANKTVLSFSTAINTENDKLKQMARIISANNPQRQLYLGYSIVRMNGKVQKSVCGLSEKDPLNITFSDGDVRSEVKSIKKHVSKKRS